MRITKIAVKNLFGTFDHDISLNCDEHITIIHGPNGYGKTILLTLINAIFNSEYHKIRFIPFDRLEIAFDDKSILILERSSHPGKGNKEKSINSSPLTFELSTSGTKVKTFSVKPFELSNLRSFPISIIEDNLPTLMRAERSTWINSITQEKLTLEEIIDHFGDQLPIPQSAFRDTKEPDWFSKIKESLNVHCIDTERLRRVSFSKTSQEIESTRKFAPSVVMYSRELVNTIQAKLADYGSLAQSLDSTFPSRLVMETNKNGFTLDELKRELSQLEERRKLLKDIGFFDKEKDIAFVDLQKVDDTNANVLSVYIEDAKKKLGVFGDITGKIVLLIKIINSRFLYKQLSIDKTEGFVFTNSEGKKLSPTNLSSGEQHELVLLYQLLFKVHPDSLILIDEPELSLHVYWQQQFLKDLGEITKLVGFDVLIATHSPQIIDDRWDLTVELKGPKQ